jgi:sugar lactone lactonase YvrE
MKRNRPFLLVAGYIASLFLTVQSAAGAPGLAVEAVPPVSSVEGSPTVFSFPDVRTNTSGTGTLRLLNPNPAAAQGITIALLKNDGTDSASQVFTIPQASQQVTVGGAWEGTSGEKEIVINFSPLTTGTHEAILKVTCSQNPEISPQQYTIRGTGTEPLISVLDPNNNALAQTPVQTVVLPPAIVSNSSSGAFTIENAGAHPLTITGITVSPGSDFTISDPIPTTVAAAQGGTNGSAQFTVTFTPSATGTRTATLEITHDDAAKSPFQVLLTATGNGPLISVLDPNNNALAQTPVQTVVLPSAIVGNSSSGAFTIENAGAHPLTITGITVSPGSDFTISDPIPTTVAAAQGGTNGSAQFTVTFTPSATGSRTTTLEISHDDSDKTPFRIRLTGSAQSPQIVVKDPANNPLAYSASAYPQVHLGNSNLGSSASYDFTIENSGDQPLTITSIQSSNNTEFVVVAVPTPVAAASGGTNGSETFTVTFSPTAIGSRTTTLEIIHDDSDKTPFRITLNASGTNATYNIAGVDITGVLASPPTGTVRAEISTDQNFRPTVDTYAGTSTPGSSNGARLGAEFSMPSGIVADGTGNLFIADTANNQIRMIDPSGQVTTIAGAPGTEGYGFTDGTGPLARFQFPSAIAIDSSGNLYVTDTFNHSVRKLTGAPGGTWTVTTLAGAGATGYVDGPGPSSRFNLPQGLAVDSSGNVYVADTGNHRIRLISPAGRVSTLVGTGVSGFDDGAAAVARLSSPIGLVLDTQDNLYVADSGNNRIRMVNPSAYVSTIAGTTTSGSSDNADAAQGKFNCPAGLIMGNDNTIYVADKLNHKIRKLTRNANAGDWSLGSVAGTGVPGSADGLEDTAQLNHPTGLALSAGNLIVADSGNNSLRRVTLQNISSSATVSGTTVNASLHAGTLGINSNTPYYVRWVDTNGTPLSTTQPPISFEIADLPEVINAQATAITDTAATVTAEVNPRFRSTTVKFEISTDSTLLPPLLVNTVPGVTGKPRGIAVDQNGNRYVADQLRHKIWKIDASSGNVTTLAGTGFAGFADSATGQTAQFDHPSGLAIDTSGNLYVADTNNHRIRKIDATTGAVTTIAGNGVATFLDNADAQLGSLKQPAGIAVNSAGTMIYVADTGNHRIRLIQIGASISTVAGSGTAGLTNGTGTSAAFNEPTGVTIDSNGNLFIADRKNHCIRKIEPNKPNKDVTTFAGSAAGFLDATPPTNAKFRNPTDVTVGSSDSLYVTDAGNNRLRKIQSGAVSTVAGSGVAGNTDSSTGSLIPPDRVSFSDPSAIALLTGSSFDTLWVTDSGNDKVRKIHRHTLPSFNAATSPLTATDNTFHAVPTSIPFNLSPGAQYYFRVVAQNARGETVGSITSFTTLTSPAIALTDETTTLNVSHSQSNAVNFGSTPLYSPVPREFTIKNIGEADLDINSITAPSGYHLTLPTLPGGAGTIPAGEERTLIVSLSANARGTYNGNLVINNNSAISAFSAPLTGLVLQPPSVTHQSATNLTLTSATLRATINPEGTPTTVWIAYSTDPDLAGVDVTTFAGSSAGFAQGTRLNAQFNTPRGLAVDADGTLFIADTANHRIRAIDPSGNTRVIAGTGSHGFAEGAAAQAQFDSPTGVVVASDGTLYVTDTGNHRIRAISPTGTVSTLAGSGTQGNTDGDADAALFNNPWGIAMETDDILYVADRDNNNIRKLTRSPQGKWSVSTLASGNFTKPLGIAVSTNGEVYVTEHGKHAIRRINNNGTVNILAGEATTSGSIDGNATAARFHSPQGLCLDPSGNLLVADTGNHRVRRIMPDGTVSTLAGSGTPGSTDGVGLDAEFENPLSVVTTPDAHVIIGESGGTLRRITSSTIVSLVHENLQGSSPLGITLPVGNLIPNTSYYFRARAQNSSGTTIGSNIESFTSRPRTPFQTWQVNEFQANATDNAIAGPNADPNNDGTVNLSKYGHGIAPYDPKCEGLPVVSTTDTNAVITYTRDQSATDVTYTIEQLNGDAWVTVPNVTEQYVALTADPARPWVDPVTVIASIPRNTDTSGNDQAPDPASFYRLVLSLQQTP